MNEHMNEPKQIQATLCHHYPVSKIGQELCDKCEDELSKYLLDKFINELIEKNKENENAQHDQSN